MCIAHSFKKVERGKLNNLPNHSPEKQTYIATYSNMYIEQSALHAEPTMGVDSSLVQNFLGQEPFAYL